jgi:hypothetical protein
MGAEVKKPRRGLAILEHREHGCRAISIQEDQGPGTCGSGYRVAGGKCCGSWPDTQYFWMTAPAWRDLAARALRAAEDLEDGA